MKRLLVLAVLLFSFLGTGAAASQDCFTLFYSETCPHCDTVESYLQDQETSHNFTVQKYEAGSNPDLFRSYVEEYSVPVSRAGAVPAVFTGEEFAVGSQNSVDLINSTLNDGKTSQCKDLDAQEENSSETQGGESQGEQSDSEKTAGLEASGILGISALALTDSVNPCALAVLLILMGSVMSGNLKEKGRALKTGLSFTAGIFMAYLSMGVLLVHGVKGIQKATSLEMNSIYLFFGGFAILVGLLNMKDWISHGLGGFVMEVPFSWRPKMKSYLKKVSGPGGAFITALLVSLFLLPCTSGPYFVAGGILSGLPWITALPLLVIYNILFVAPMLLIIAALYLGTTEVERIQEWRKNKIEELHLVAGVILVLLGVFLLLSSL